MIVLVVLLVLVLAAVVSLVIVVLRSRSEQRDASEHAEQVLQEAERVRSEAEQMRTEAEQIAEDHRRELRELRLSQNRQDERLAQREDRLAEEARVLDTRAQQLEQEHQHLRERQAELRVAREKLARSEEQQLAELERIAALTVDQAREELIESIRDDAKRRALVTVRDIEQQAIREGETRARTLIVDAMQRVASEQTTESVVTTVDLPHDDMKGRIIGREGRNIRAFEQITGVNVMIDDTPGSVLLSCFDPVRRETARLTLEALVADGRIHPARIEEAHERSTRRIAERCARAAEDALVEVGISDLDPALVELVGMLRYRTSYGQNVLKHLVECSHLAGMMAAELGLDTKVSRRAAFLHDIGKALTHEVEGSHALIGADLARRHGESPEVVHAIEAHHNEVEPSTVVAVLTQVADQISGGRPGARRESLESYVKRLERLEAIAASRDGVEKVFAMQAGREVRVMVDPGEVDDIDAQVLARDIVKQVEEELTYPGQIRVTVVRESRATEVAR